MKITQELAQLLLELYENGDSTTDWKDDWFEGESRVNFRLVHAAMVDTTRWSHVYERVYWDLDTGKYWRTTYMTGATECQDESPYENDGAEIEFNEVVPVEIKKTIYKAVK
ncbi:hypothetical protein D3C87_1014010 [compost metagenome]